MSFFRDPDDFCEEHPDVVILACAILALEKVIGSLPLQRLRRSTLIVDVLSVKQFPKQLLLSMLPPEVMSSCQHCASTCSFALRNGLLVDFGSCCRPGLKLRYE